MHCLRRAALRAAQSSPRFVAVPRQQVAAVAMQLSKANVQPVGVLHLPRYFSRTASVAEEKEVADSAVEDAVAAASQMGSTATSESTQPESASTQPTEYSIFISNMNFDATDMHLTEAFGKYGDILRVNIARDGRGLSRGFGFITFDNKDSADRAVREAHNSFWHGRRISVEYRKDRGAADRNNRSGVSGPTNSLYIGNIPYEASDADLNQMFRSLDNVTDVRVAVDRNTGWPRGFAHADFKDVASAEKAFQDLAEKTLNGRKLRVDYAQARPQNATNGN